MEKNLAIANVDKPVSELVQGSSWFALNEQERLFELLDEFVAHGGTAIDTARCYGESEEVIGRWLEARGHREEIFLITKGGMAEEGPPRLVVDGFAEKIDRDLTESLDHLRTDYIDLYFLHRDAPSFPVGPIVEGLNAELERGRIRAFGGSNWEPRRIDEANEYAAQHGLTGFAAVSNHLSLAVPTGPFYEGLLWVDPAARRWHVERGIPNFSWASLARGFFTGRFSREMRERVARSDASLSWFDCQMIRIYGTDDNYERLRRAEELGARKGYSAVQIALAWLLHQPFEIPVVGPHTPEEVASCAAATEIELTEEEVQWLNLEAG